MKTYGTAYWQGLRFKERPIDVAWPISNMSQDQALNALPYFKLPVIAKGGSGLGFHA